MWHSDSDSCKRRKFPQIPPFKNPPNAGPNQSNSPTSFCRRAALARYPKGQKVLSGVFQTVFWIPDLGFRRKHSPSDVRDPLQESSVSSGPKSPPEVPERVSPKSGVCLGVSEGVLQGSFEPRPKMCPKSDLKVSKKTLFGHF